ncbi:MAG: HPr family phosphocarrier protein [Bacillota bacterium]
MQQNSVDVLITNKSGLHARPASLFVQEANKYNSEIEINCKDKTVNAKSILSILGLGANKGSTVIISAKGEDAGAALNGLKEFVEKELPRVDDEQ